MIKRRKIQFTKDGFEKVKAEYDELTYKRKFALKELVIARDMGDRSENGAYIAGRKKLSSIDSRLRHLTNLIRNAEIVEPLKNGLIGIGSEVTLNDGQNTFEYTIVGGFESDLLHGKLSNVSPIGRALMNKKIGDTVQVFVPAGTVTYTVVNVLV